MHNSLTDYLDYWDSKIEKIGKLLRTKYSIEEEMPMNYKSVVSILLAFFLILVQLGFGFHGEFGLQTSFNLIGRIACYGGGRFNSKSVLLEGTSDNASGEAADLDLSILKKYSIFPGQIVAVEAYNLTKDRLVVKELYSDVDIEYFKPFELPRGSLNVMIASGPYTPSDSMTYEPLLDLVKEVVRAEPHVLILTAPFIECNKKAVLATDVLAETIEDFLEKIIEQIMKPLEGWEELLTFIFKMVFILGTCDLKVVLLLKIILTLFVGYLIMLTFPLLFDNLK